uniref:uncharacterized protein LOC105353252 n=1 Tax=Fragaria vesca subsp. vesca TaxID=101020 RepID=UPI0005C92458|nr:PREDICTED: uncharacterized protein LOC105353252 [Fragaria vesca subsp. vesca]
MSFSDLICLLAKKKRHQEIIFNNNARPVGNKKIPESNQTSGGKAPRKRRNRKPAPYEREQYQPCGCGNGNNRRGNNSNNTWRREDGNSAPPRNNNCGRGRQGEKSGQGRNPPSNSNQKRRSPCYMCGSTAHLHRDCRASKEAIDTYRRHKQYLAQEANFTGGDDIGAEPSTNLTIADFVAKKQASPAHMDAADFA